VQIRESSYIQWVVRDARSGTKAGIGGGALARLGGIGALAAALFAGGAVTAVAFGGTASADQVSNLNAQAKRIAQELVEEQLQSDAFAQQYSVASVRVADDQRAIAATQRQIATDRRQIDAGLRRVRHLAITAYVMDGSVSSPTAAGLFAEDVSTVQTADEYATVAVGNLEDALDALHTSQRAAASQQLALVGQSARDRAAQAQQASYLSQANASVAQLASVQAQAKGQLANAVAAQDAALSRAAVTAVVTAQRSGAGRSPPTGTGSPATAPVVADIPSPTTDPALNPFLQCVVQAESGGNYQAVSPNGLYMGAFQFSQATWNYAAEAAGLSYLVGVPPNRASKAAQDTVAVALYALDGERPWLGDRCSS